MKLEQLVEAFIRTLKLEKEDLKDSVDKMAAVEEDAKEYRWETGYEKVFFLFIDHDQVGWSSYVIFRHGRP